MSKEFTVTGKCIPSENYMVNIDERILEIRKMVESKKYFCINRGRQYGKTTTLSLLKKNLEEDFTVFSISFEGLDKAFDSLENIGITFFSLLETETKKRIPIKNISDSAKLFLENDFDFSGKDGEHKLSNAISEFCEKNEKPIVILIDEVDQASNYDSFLKFLGLLRDKYLNRDEDITFHSVILAGVYDIKNLKLKIRPESDHQYNSPWNIAAKFDVDMDLHSDGIAKMLDEYASDNKIEFDTKKIADLIEEYTSGYPYLVSRMCQIMDDDVPKIEGFDKTSAWSEMGFLEAVKLMLKDENTLFDDMRKKLDDFPSMRNVLNEILYKGKSFAFNQYDKDMSVAKMFNFIKEVDGKVAVFNRIFETWFYNLFVVEASIENAVSNSNSSSIFDEGSKDREIFIKENGELDMPLILERFIFHFTDLYGDKDGNFDTKFVENEGRKFFLFFIKPIINGTGNYYVEARTRNERRTDVIVDYKGKQYIIELKIWRGDKYQKDGEQQTLDYLNYYNLQTGYMLIFNFNQNKKQGVFEKKIGEKTVFEAFV